MAQAWGHIRLSVPVDSPCHHCAFRCKSHAVPAACGNHYRIAQPGGHVGLAAASPGEHCAITAKRQAVRATTFNGHDIRQHRDTGLGVIVASPGEDLAEVWRGCRCGKTNGKNYRQNADLC